MKGIQVDTFLFECETPQCRKKISTTNEEDVMCDVTPLKLGGSNQDNRFGSWFEDGCHPHTAPSSDENSTNQKEQMNF